MRLGLDRRNGTTGLQPCLDLGRIEPKHVARQPEAGDLAGTVLVTRIQRVSDKRWRINWGWLPAAIFFAVIGWSRYGLWLVLLIALGVGVGVYGEWKARRRRAKGL